MPAFFNIQWLNEASQRTYPFAEHASREDETASIKIPDDFLLELYLPVATIVETLPDRFFLRTLGIIGGGYTLEIAYDDGTADPPIVATTNISSLNFTENTRYALVGINDFDDTVGKIVVGSLSNIGRLPAGVYTFTPSAGALDPDTIRPIIRGVSSIITEQNGQRSPKLRNNIVLAAGDNMRITTSLVAGEDPVIRLDAVPGEDFDEQCACTEVEPPCIRTINDIPGDPQQNFTLLGDPCIKLQPITNGLQIVDQCCAPCCGDAELNEVIRAFRGLRNTAATIDAFVRNLGAAMTQLQLNLALSGLTGCGCTDSGSGGGGGGDSENPNPDPDTDTTYIELLAGDITPVRNYRWRFVYTLRDALVQSNGLLLFDTPTLGQVSLTRPDDPRTVWFGPWDESSVSPSQIKQWLTTNTNWINGPSPFLGASITVKVVDCPYTYVDIDEVAHNYVYGGVGLYMPQFLAANIVPPTSSPYVLWIEWREDSPEFLTEPADQAGVGGTTKAELTNYAAICE